MIKKVLPLMLLLLGFYGCHVGRFFIYNFADIRDYKKFPARELKKSGQPFFFTEVPNADSMVKLPKEFRRRHKSYSFEETLKSTGTVAFLVIRNDSILYQWYRPHYNAASIVPSFSMAKSYVSALVGIALSEGAIKSTGEPITNYLDFLDKKQFSGITIQHLLDMQSGILYKENYFNPFGDVAKYYYGTNLKKYVKHLKIKEVSGRRFEYVSLNTQLLGLIVEKATGKTLTGYLQEKIWSQIGTEFDASWSIDSKKQQTEKAFCCINARAKDFAKFGRLYLHQGNWQGRQVVPAAWVKESVTFSAVKNNFMYSNQWWHTNKFYSLSDSLRINSPYIVRNSTYQGKPVKYLMAASGNYFAEGFLGQFIYVAPKKNMILVRLAKKGGWVYWPYAFDAIVEKN